MMLKTALRLAAENRKLQDDCDRLFVALCLANAATDKAIAERDRLLEKCAVLQRDGELLGCLVADRHEALGWLRLAHAIDRMETVDG